jgi:hypothetical protein
MSLKIPQNQIVKSKYTAGKEYIFENNYKEYQGYYYEINGKIFAGKEFNVNSPVLIKITSDSINTLLTRATTYVYGKISNVTLDNSIPSSYYFNSNTTNNTFRYFTSKDNLIKEVDENTFSRFNNNPLYSSVKIYYQNGFSEDDLNNVNIKIPGLKTYIQSTYAPGVND